MQRYKTNGVLDANFGKGGKVINEINNAISSINAITIQPDGKIVAVGRYCGSGSPFNVSNCEFAQRAIIHEYLQRLVSGNIIIVY